MAQRRQLRVYFGPDDARSAPLNKVQESDGVVEVSLSEVLDTLGEAVRKDRAWVEDFRDERITISTDLYEVIAAYRHLKRAA